MQPLIPDTTYHIYNHANGFENVFKQAENYRFFMEKYRLHIVPIAETYAYCLMPNHFHLAVRIRKRETIQSLIRNKNNPPAVPDKTLSFSAKKSSNDLNEERSVVFNSEINSSKVPNFGRVHISTSNERVYISTSSPNEQAQISPGEIEKFLSKQFANLFSSYTQSFNKVYNRMGSLFVKNFKREPILDKTHFLNTVVYIHRNPIHHGFCGSFEEWPYCSYNRIVYDVESMVEKEKLLKMTGGFDSFIEIHNAGLSRLESLVQFDIP